jgi:quinol monooxygenase YgiN
MKRSRAVGRACFALAAALCGARLLSQTMNTPIVRLAELEVAPGQIERFKAAGIENITRTLNAEPDVLEFHAVIERDLPGHVVILEVYANPHACETHRQSPHFQRFGAVIAPMVTNKTLRDATPVILGRKPDISSPRPHVRIAKIEVEPSQLDDYKTAVTEEIEASIRAEPGVLAIFCVALKDAPNQLRFLEIYADEGAYLRHRETLHFRKYLEVTKPMIRSLKLFEAEPIMLGTRPVHSSK